MHKNDLNPESDRPYPELVMVPQAGAGISIMKKKMMQMAECLRESIGAYSIKIEIETDCDEEQRCDICINI